MNKYLILTLILFYVLPSYILYAQKKSSDPVIRTHASPSKDGSIVFHSNKEGTNDIYVLDKNGTLTNITESSEADDKWPGSWSPDGSLFGFSSDRTGDLDIYLWNNKTKKLRNLTNHPSRDGILFWKPNGSKVGFHSTRSGKFQIYTMNIDGSDLKNITNSSSIEILGDWSPDGKSIVFASYRNSTDSKNISQIYVMNEDGSNQRRLTFDDNFYYGATWSPDGSKIAVAGTIDGNRDIYLIDFDNPRKEPTRLTTHPALEQWPRWSSDGSKIIFSSEMSGVFDIYEVDIKTKKIKPIFSQ